MTLQNKASKSDVYLPLKFAGRRNFLSSSLKMPQHPLIQLAILFLPCSVLFYHAIFVYFCCKFLSHAWHMTVENILPRRRCRTSASWKNVITQKIKEKFVKSQRKGLNICRSLKKFIIFFKSQVKLDNFESCYRRTVFAKYMTY